MFVWRQPLMGIISVTPPPWRWACKRRDRNRLHLFSVYLLHGLSTPTDHTHPICHCCAGHSHPVWQTQTKPQCIQLHFQAKYTHNTQMITTAFSFTNFYSRFKKCTHTLCQKVRQINTTEYVLCWLGTGKECGLSCVQGIKVWPLRFHLNTVTTIFTLSMHITPLMVLFQ